jgi:amino acid transporter
MDFKPDIFAHGLFPIALLFSGFMCFRYKQTTLGISCWIFALGIYLVIANKFGIDALGAVVAINMIWGTIFLIVGGVLFVMGGAIGFMNNNLPRADNGGSQASRRPSRPRGRIKARPARSVKEEPFVPPQIAPSAPPRNK